MTQKHINAIARATKSLHPQGMGNRIVVFADGSYMEAVSDNDVIGRGNGSGGWDYRIAIFHLPQTRASVAEVIGRAEAARARSGD